MDFSLSPEQTVLQQRTRLFVRDGVMPCERYARQTSHGPGKALRQELVEHAPDEGNPESITVQPCSQR